MKEKERLSRTITINITESEYAAIKQHAKKSGKTVAMLIIESINDHTGITFQDRTAYNRYYKGAPADE